MCDLKKDMPDVDIKFETKKIVCEPRKLKGRGYTLRKHYTTLHVRGKGRYGLYKLWGMIKPPSDELKVYHSIDAEEEIIKMLEEQCSKEFQKELEEYEKNKGEV